MSILANKNAIGGGNYLIERSLRFQSASTQYLNRTFGTPTSSTTWTWSGWVKIGTISTYKHLIYAQETSSSNRTQLFFSNSNELVFVSVDSSVISLNLVTTQVFRDPSAWYHIVLAFDTTQATASNRVKIYVNGSQVTAFSAATYPAQNYATARWNKSGIVGYHGTSLVAGEYLDGYMTEINFIDGQALTPSSFGETDALTGVWVAKRYTGTYGTNGFYLKFNDGTSTTTLGQDRSGNANNWTLTNFTRSAGVSDCWMYDVPSGNGSPSATQPSSNYAVLNSTSVGTDGTISAANLNIAYGTAVTRLSTLATIGMSSGKWYWEFQKTAQSSPNAISGITNVSSPNQVGVYPGINANAWSYSDDGLKYNNGTGSSYGATWTTNDVIGVAFDADAGTLTFYKNNTSQGIAYSSLTSGPYFPVVGDGSTAGTFTMAFNFGQRSFAYTPPSGFKALCTANLPAPTIAKGNEYMDAFIYTGDGNTTKTVTLPFAADFVWSKNRTTANDHVLIDTVRGGTSPVKALFSNTTGAELTTTGAWGGFGYPDSLSGTSYAVVKGTQATSYTNKLNDSYVNWLWKAGSSTVTNTSGTISSQVRANTTAGFSIVTYTGNGTNGATVGHGLGVTPAMVIIKNRTSGNTNSWRVYHKVFGTSSVTQTLFLEAQNAATTDSNIVTAVSSTTFTLGIAAGNTSVNGNTNTYVAYCFAEIAGFSKVGSYTGNGSTDGVFLYCGFRPKFLLVKRYTASTLENWYIHDSIRSPDNVADDVLSPNLSAAEVTSTARNIDFVSNGVKLRTSDPSHNGSSDTYIFMAFAENPFNYSNAR